MRMSGAMLVRMARVRLMGKSPLGAFLRLSEWCCNRLPRSVAAARPLSSIARGLHSLVRLQDRRMYLGTFFLRNRPELELLRRLSGLGSEGRRVRIAVLGSSNGAEVYSIAWVLRSAQPDAKLDMHAVDISPAAVEAARKGLYEPGRSELVD